MRSVHICRTGIEAHFLCGLLEGEGIRAMIQGEMLENVYAGFADVLRMSPEIYVYEQDIPAARAVIQDYLQRTGKECDSNLPPHPIWICPECGEPIEEQFTECWRCNTPREAMWE